jgi:hypothetical protein
MTSGDPFEEQMKLKELLKLPEQFDILATTTKLLTTTGDVKSLQQNPFVLPE